MPEYIEHTDASNVQVAVTGAVYVGAVGAALPSIPLDPVTLPPELGVLVGWTSVGYISEDGVKEANDVESDEIKAWQNSDIVRKTITKSETSYAFTMIETNAQALSLFYGHDVAVGGNTHVIGGSASKRVALVIDAVDGNQVIRRHIPSAEVTERGEVTLSASDASGYEVTVTAYPDATLGGSVEVFYKEVLK